MKVPVTPATAAATVTDVQGGFDVVATLDHLDELFAPPRLDPLRGRLRTLSVAEEIVARIRSRSLRRPPSIRLTILLPASKLDGVRQSDVASAIRSYAAAMAGQTEQSMRINRFEGLAMMPWGALVGVGVLLLVLGIYALLPATVQPLFGVVTPFVTVLIWVAIWTPVEYLVYESWSLRRRRRAYLALGAGISVVRVAAREPAVEPGT